MLLLRHLRSKPSHTSLLSPFNSFYRLLSTPQDGSASPSLNFAVQYLIQSCGLPSDRAAKVSRYLPHLKSPEKPDSVLRFLRQAGVTEPHIKAAALRDPAFLCYSIEKCFKPRVAELREVGFTTADISLLLSIWPPAFHYNDLQCKIQFWLRFFGTVEKLLRALKSSFVILSVNLENTAVLNLAFLREECQLPACQISQLVIQYPSTITSKPEVFKMRVKRAQNLGVSCLSRMFVYALGVISKLNENIVDGRLRYLKNLGFSQEEVTLLITKCPTILTHTEKLIGKKMEFLLKDVGYAQIDVLRNPSILTYSLEKRLIPRSLVRKLLRSKGIPAANNAFIYVAKFNEKQFLEKFVLPYEGTVPGLLQAYTDACAGNTTARG